VTEGHLYKMLPHLEATILLCGIEKNQTKTTSTHYYI